MLTLQDMANFNDSVSALRDMDEKVSDLQKGHPEVKGQASAVDQGVAELVC